MSICWHYYIPPFFSNYLVLCPSGLLPPLFLFHLSLFVVKSWSTVQGIAPSHTCPASPLVPFPTTLLINGKIAVFLFLTFSRFNCRTKLDKI